MLLELYDYQKAAIDRMHNGCILCGGVGSGKSRTSLAYYFLGHGGQIKDNGELSVEGSLPDLYIITTARKRDTFEWDEEMLPFLLSTNLGMNKWANHVEINSWNNIERYKSITNAFFIFDEQRVVGDGVWVDNFLKITRNNEWILLSATPGDTWSDYIPVFVANGFYRNRTEFNKQHVVLNPFLNFPKVDRYVNVKRLERLRERVLVDMDYKRITVRNHIDIWCDYDKVGYRTIMRSRENPYEHKHIDTASELCQTLRHLINTDSSRLSEVLKIVDTKKRVIIFYNFDYELELLKGLDYGKGVRIAEWNGHKHQPVPDSPKWVYLVQYYAGAEGWNCTVTDTVIFFSQNYSYKIMEQSSGRIDRLNTPFKDLYYYTLKSKAPIDLAIAEAIRNKKKFNENRFVNSNT